MLSWIALFPTDSDPPSIIQSKTKSLSSFHYTPLSSTLVRPFFIHIFPSFSSRSIQLFLSFKQFLFKNFFTYQIQFKRLISFTLFIKGRSHPHVFFFTKTFSSFHFVNKNPFTLTFSKQKHFYFSIFLAPTLMFTKLRSLGLLSFTTSSTSVHATLQYFSSYFFWSYTYFLNSRVAQ